MLAPETELNDQQREAVNHLFGPLVVMAPVGTGKTTVLAHRAAAAIRAGVEPGHILCLSFTNRAAREMRERIRQLIGVPAGQITVRTFHGLCAYVLRYEAETLGIPADFTVCDEEDVRAGLVNLCRRQGLDGEYLDKLAGILSHFLQRVKLAPYSEEDPDRLDDYFAAAVRQSSLSFADLPRVDLRRVVSDYQQFLLANSVLDFTDLILHVARLFSDFPEALERWRQHYSWLQVDEVQDVTLAEYGIVARLAAVSKDVALFGDFDQTIYEWRGSQPHRVLGKFQRQFDPVREILLTKNYRATRHMLRACEAFIHANRRFVTLAIEPMTHVPGNKVFLHTEATPQDEAHWIADAIEVLRTEGGIPNREIAVLTRTNAANDEVARALEARGIEHLVIDHFRFFRRMEVKDAISYLRFLLNGRDSQSLLRLLQRPPGKVAPGIVEQVRTVPAEVGLRLTDFLDPVTYQYGDPFGLLLEKLGQGQVVVFDVEATGLDLAQDEIIELAAVRLSPSPLAPGGRGVGGAGVAWGSPGVATPGLGAFPLTPDLSHAGPPRGEGGKTADRFHEYLFPAKSVGESARVHNLTDDFLAAHGRPAAEVLSAFLHFSAGCLLLGHNVHYDVNILGSQLRRLGLPHPPRFASADTLDMARRFYRLPSYTLAALCRELRLPVTPSHRAADDVDATCALLDVLLPHLRRRKAERERLVAQYAPALRPLADCFERWRALVDEERPAALLQRILDESGLFAYWERQSDGGKAAARLRDLVALFRRYDDPTMAPRDALLTIANLASLGVETDKYLEREDKVVVLTVHQAKGMEFDAVFIAGATDNDFPSRRSQKEGRLEEEHRLFYVALTRARNVLVITYPARDNANRPQPPSRYLAQIPAELRQQLGPDGGLTGLLSP
jgi:DNA helicase-2/ATP-dependent DNA helicase PcrA